MNSSQITISPGNTKLGNIPSISLPKEKTCNPELPCYKYCYTNKLARYPSVGKAYLKNWNIYGNNGQEYFKQLNEYIGKNNPKYFRYHVSGDIVDYAYFKSIVFLAESYPKTSFLLYTKKYSIINEYIDHYRFLPNNLQILFSSIIDKTKFNLERDNPYNLNICWYQDKEENENRIPGNAKVCKGDCTRCKACYTVNKHQTDIVIPHH